MASNETLHLTVRMPAGLRDRLRSRAEVNRRSMNSEIVHQLDRATADEKAKGPAEGATSPGHDQNHNPAKNGGVDA